MILIPIYFYFHYLLFFINLFFYVFIIINLIFIQRNFEIWVKNNLSVPYSEKKNIENQAFYFICPKKYLEKIKPHHNDYFYVSWSWWINMIQRMEETQSSLKCQIIWCFCGGVCVLNSCCWLKLQLSTFKFIEENMKIR